MSKVCKLYGGTVLYLDCIECDDRELCIRGKRKMNKIVIGIDQSYKNTGVSIAVDNKLRQITSIPLEDIRSNSEKRNLLRHKFNKLFSKASTMVKSEPCECIVIIERIRLRSEGFLNIDYIKSIGALNALIVDEASKFGLKVYSVDTRAWKSAIVGTSKEMSNKYGIDPKKWPTILYIKSLGYEEQIKREVGKRKKKGVIEKDGERFTYNDDAADSACIALYGFIPESKQLLQEEH